MPRKRHDQTSPEEWREFLDAFEALHSLDAPFPRHIDFLDVHVRMHEERYPRGLHPRHHPHFLAWHRHLLWKFERALQEVRRGVCIPYWCWHTEPAIPAALDEPRMLQRWGVSRNFRFHEMPTRVDIDVVRAQMSFHTFERLVEVLLH